MKNETKIILSLIAGIFCFSAALSSQETAQAGGGRVTAAEIHPVNKITTGHCPAKVEFTGRITTDGPAVVKYRVAQDDVGHIRSESEEHTLIFREAGSHSVSYSLTPTQSMNSWVALHISAPNELETPPEAGAFILKCQR